MEAAQGVKKGKRIYRKYEQPRKLKQMKRYETGKGRTLLKFRSRKKKLAKKITRGK